MRIRSKRLAVALGPITAAAVTVTALVLTPWASASHVAPYVKSGNPSCATVEGGAGLTEFRIEPVADGTYSDGTLTVTLAVNESAKTFDWSANRLVEIVIVKGGPKGANVYDYPSPGDTSDTGLQSPGNSGLSHLSFCYNPSEPPPSTTTTTTTDPKTTDPTTTTTTDPKPPDQRCTGRAFDVRLDTAGVLNGFVGPFAATDQDVFPDRDTVSDLSVIFPLTGATEPVIRAVTLDAENSVDAEGRCVTRAQIENLDIDLNKISPSQGIPVKIHVDVLKTVSTAKLNNDGTAATTSQVVLVGGSIDVNGQGGGQDGEIPPNTNVIDECFTNPSGPGELCVTVILHETALIPNGISANAIRVKVNLVTGLPPTSSQLVDLQVAHAEADAHAS